MVPTMGEMVNLWKKNHNTFGILYDWFLAKVASKLEVFPGSEFCVAYKEAMKYGGNCNKVSIFQLKDDKGQFMGVDTSNLLIANSGNEMSVIDLTRVSQELAYLASDADLVVLEGMSRGIETNLYDQFKCDSMKIGMVKHPEVAQFLGGSVTSSTRSGRMGLKDHIIISINNFTHPPTDGKTTFHKSIVPSEEVDANMA